MQRVAVMDLQEAIYELTPGGSEFHDSPIQCLEFIKGRLDAVGKVAKERNDYRDQLTEAKILLEKWAMAFPNGTQSETIRILIEETAKFNGEEYGHTRSS